MDQRPPLEISRLLEASDDLSRQRAWEAFLTQYNRMLLHVSRSIDREYDGVMNRYEYMLEQLRADDFRRLRKYENDERTKFLTWGSRSRRSHSTWCANSRTSLSASSSASSISSRPG